MNLNSLISPIPIWETKVNLIAPALQIRIFTPGFSKKTRCCRCIIFAFFFFFLNWKMPSAELAIRSYDLSLFNKYVWEVKIQVTWFLSCNRWNYNFLIFIGFTAASYRLLKEEQATFQQSKNSCSLAARGSHQQMRSLLPLWGKYSISSYEAAEDNTTVVYYQSCAL